MPASRAVVACSFLAVVLGLHVTRLRLARFCLARDLRCLNARGFGAVLSVSPRSVHLLWDPLVSHWLRKLWRAHGGLLVLRGLFGLTASELLKVSAIFGEVEANLDDSKKFCEVETPNDVEGSVMRIGNAKNNKGELVSMFALDPLLPPNGDPTYRVKDRRPVWHTDSTYRQDPPIGSLLYCKRAPPAGAATCFADTTSAFQALPDEQKQRLRTLECVCSLAHHDAKVHSYSPDYPTLTPMQRAQNPPNRAPMVLQHPLTGFVRIAEPATPNQATIIS